jgi:hypothetical protein
MKKAKSNESFPIWVLWAVILIIIVALCYIFRSEKTKQYKHDLKEKINEKEQYISSLTKELNKLIAIKDCLTMQAIQFFRFLKLALFLLLLSIGIISYALFNLNAMEAITVIGTVVSIFSLFYYGCTIIISNKLGNIERTLEVLQEYFITREFKRNGFELILIEAYESKLNKEACELKELREKYNCYLLGDGKY